MHACVQCFVPECFCFVFCMCFCRILKSGLILSEPPDSWSFILESVPRSHELSGRYEVFSLRTELILDMSEHRHWMKLVRRKLRIIWLPHGATNTVRTVELHWSTYLCFLYHVELILFTVVSIYQTTMLFLSIYQHIAVLGLDIIVLNTWTHGIGHNFIGNTWANFVCASL